MPDTPSFIPLTNRSTAISGPRFALPEDGFVQLVPKGSAPNALEDETRIIQLVDDIALTSMFNRALERGGELLIDYEHFSHDEQKPTDAAAWQPLDKDHLQIRVDGIWGKPRWSDDGEKAVTGGRLRFVSPEFPGGGPFLQQVSGKVYRPLEITGFGLTNRPGFKRQAKPLTNSGRRELPADKPKNTMHKALLALALGLPETDVDGLDETTLRNRAQELRKEVAKAANLQREADQRREADADAFIAKYEPVLKNRDQGVKEALRKMYLSDEKTATAFADSFGPADGLTEEQRDRAERTPLFNRGDAKAPAKQGEKKAAQLASQRSAHAHTLCNRDKLSWSDAWQQACQAFPDSE